MTGFRLPWFQRSLVSTFRTSGPTHPASHFIKILKNGSVSFTQQNFTGVCYVLDIVPIGGINHTYTFFILTP